MRHHSTLLLAGIEVRSSSPAHCPHHPAKDMGKSSVSWEFCHCWLRVGAVVTQGLKALLSLMPFVTHLYHSPRAWLGRDNLREAVCHYRSAHFSKSGKKILFLLWDIIIQFPFSPWEHWKCPLLVYLLFQAEECSALVWQIWGHNPTPTSLPAAGAARVG